jgi:hypothetical protein
MLLRALGCHEKPSIFDFFFILCTFVPSKDSRNMLVLKNWEILVLSKNL